MIEHLRIDVDKNDLKQRENSHWFQILSDFLHTKTFSLYLITHLHVNSLLEYSTAVSNELLQLPMHWILTYLTSFIAHYDNYETLQKYHLCFTEAIKKKRTCLKSWHFPQKVTKKVIVIIIPLHKNAKYIITSLSRIFYLFWRDLNSIPTTNSFRQKPFHVQFG